MGEMFGNETKITNKWGYTFPPNQPANPCGLFPKSFFNDTYVMLDKFGNMVNLNQTNISNEYEKNYFYKRFQNSSLNYTTTQWIDVEDEHFIVWMAMETFNTFRKLWARIETDLSPGNYTFLINDSN